MQNERREEEIFALCDVIRQTSFEIHKYLRCGHLEKVYENALAHRLRKKGLHVRQKDPIHVFDGRSLTWKARSGPDHR
jgi:GxxExxY protein